MIYALILLAVSLIIALALIGMGFYEFYRENKQDRAVFDRMGHNLHMKHLDEINNGNK